MLAKPDTVCYNRCEAMLREDKGQQKEEIKVGVIKGKKGPETRNENSGSL